MKKKTLFKNKSFTIPVFFVSFVLFFVLGNSILFGHPLGYDNQLSFVLTQYFFFFMSFLYLIISIRDFFTLKWEDDILYLFLTVSKKRQSKFISRLKNEWKKEIKK